MRTETPVDDDLFDGAALVNGALVTAAAALALVLVPTPVAVPVLVALAFAAGRLGGRDAGLGSVGVGSLMFGYAITEPHFVWEIEDDRDIVLLIVLFVASLVASEVGARLRFRRRRREGIDGRSR